MGRGSWIRLLSALTSLLLGYIALAGQPDLPNVLSILRSSPTGHALLVQATRVWHTHTEAELLAHFKWGPASKTDAVLVRTYDPLTGRESREREVTVVLRQDQPLETLILDLAHELVHATSKPEWDPYDEGLTAARYVQVAIEGVGGEVRAVATECQVSFELADRDPSQSSFSRCRKYYDPKSKTIVLEAVKRDFYRSGPWAQAFQEAMGKDAVLFPLLSNEPVTLYSSTGGAPYPASLLEEYKQMTATACENSRKRHENSAAPLRAPASDLSSSLRCHQ